MIVMYVLVIYFAVLVALRFLVPHLGFSKTKIPDSIPLDLENKISELKKEATSKREYLELAYRYVVEKYSGGHVHTVLKFWRAFGTVFDKEKGFLPCTMQNFLLRVILVRGGFFKDEDIVVKVVPLNFFIHQYLIVRIGNELIEVDPWSNFKGMGLGEKTFLFG